MSRWSIALVTLALLVVPACKSPRDAGPTGKPDHPPAASAEGLGASALEETQRLLLLRMQAGYIDREPPYGQLPAPPGLESLLTRDGAIEASQLETARAKWESSRERVAESPAAFFWLTERLEERYEQAARLDDARDVEEAAAGLLADPGYRQVLRCHLARLAASRNDLIGAHVWLAGIDERPTDINLDSELRMAHVALAFAEHDWAGALARLGRTRQDVPFASRWAVNASVKRAHALEQLGEVEAAADEILYWMRGPRDRAMVLRVPASSFAQQIDRMVAMHGYAPASYALAKERLRSPKTLATRRVPPGRQVSGDDEKGWYTLYSSTSDGTR